MTKAVAIGDQTAGGIAARFRSFLPVVIDVETGGFNANTDALLEIAAVLLNSMMKVISRHASRFDIT